ncbi:MAG: hypothetical protein PHU08_00040 [Dehalococcoidales bacterium]|nr:hypothetical protein [Dehalococcoidales bacterium]
MTQEKSTDIVVQSSSALALPDENTFKHDLQSINKFQQIVRANMIEGQDYGVIPGTDKPSLYKPGAEKITKLLGLCDRYEVIEKVQDWAKPFFHYMVKCQLIAASSGITISDGLGSCNSMEARYRWRDAKKKCPECGKETIIKGKEEYGGGWICFGKLGGCGAKWPGGTEAIEKQVTGRVENDDIYSLVNTLLKMAEKRALVDAALHAGRLSNIFTQDVEDMPAFSSDAKAAKPANTEPAKAQPAKTAAKAPANPDGITEAQLKKLFAAAKEKGLEHQTVVAYMTSVYGVSSSSGLTKRQASELIEAIEQGSVAPAAEAKQPELTDGDFK